MAKQVRPPALAEPFNIETYQSEVLQQWRRAVAAMTELEPKLYNQDLTSALRADYSRYYERMCERERVFFC